MVQECHFPLLFIIRRPGVLYAKMGSGGGREIRMESEDGFRLISCQRDTLRINSTLCSMLPHHPFLASILPLFLYNGSRIYETTYTLNNIARDIIFVPERLFLSIIKPHLSKDGFWGW